MAVVDRPIHCVVTPPESSISITPTRLNVPNSAVDDNRLVWTIPAENSGTFASTEFFEWKGDAESIGAPAVSFVNSKRLESGTYSNGLGQPRRVWQYKIKVSNEWVDPEVNNQPPGGGPGGDPGGPGGGAGGPGGGAGGPGGGPGGPGGGPGGPGGGPGGPGGGPESQQP